MMELHPILEKGEIPGRSHMWYVVSAGGCAQPTMRVGHSSIALPLKRQTQQKILLTGGANPSGVFPESHLLNLDSYEWETTVWKGLKGRYEHTAFMPTTQSDKVFIFGGADQSGNLNDVQVLDLGTGTWTGVTASGEFPSPRTCRGSAYCGDQLFIFSGGEQGTDPVADCKMHVFNSVHGTWKQPRVSGKVPRPRHGHAMAAIEMKLYLHGGMARETFYDDLHVYDTETCEWSSVTCSGDLPPGTAAHGVVAHGQKLIMFGGMTKSGASDSTYVLDTRNFCWKKVELNGPPPASRLDHAMCILTMSSQRAPPSVETQRTSTDIPSGIIDVTEDAMFVVDGVPNCLKDNEGGEAPPYINRERLAGEEGKELQSDVSPNVNGQKNEDIGGATPEGSSNDSNEVVTCVFVHGGMDTGGQIFDDCLVMRLNDL